MLPDLALAEKHNLLSETKFRLKLLVHIARRKIKNAVSAPARFPANNQLSNFPVIAFSESDLWNKDDVPENWILTAGKVENLRIAARKLNGIEVGANQVFSFWKHIGYPGKSRGFVLGREIREGCIVPTIAGGLCQLSNGLYDAALKAGFEIIERHRHTRVIKGSLAEQDRDATVKWNYVDLRFRASQAFRIETELTADKLIIRFKISPGYLGTGNSQKIEKPSSKLNDCFSCGNLECFKHPGSASIKLERSITTFITDANWPEYAAYTNRVSNERDFFIGTTDGGIAKGQPSGSKSRNLKTLAAQKLERSIQLRLAAKTHRNIFAATLLADKKIALAAVKQIPVESTHLVIAQNLLPYLWEAGALGGRTFDVLMTRLPMEKLHERLDFAHRQHAESPTLNDFRAGQQLIDLENIALTKARSIITPHQEIAEIFVHKSIRLPWSMPKATPGTSPSGDKILFPASALARKGAYEIRELVKTLNCSIVIAGRATEHEEFFKGLDVSFAGEDAFKDIGLVVYPTYVEHQPRLLLKAIAAGIPVITTTASGLQPTPGVTVVPTGNYEALKMAVVGQMTQGSESQAEIY